MRSAPTNSWTSPSCSAPRPMSPATWARCPPQRDGAVGRIYDLRPADRRWPTSAARNGREQAVAGQIFRRRQRELGLRRQHAPRIFRRPAHAATRPSSRRPGHRADHPRRERRQWRRLQLDRGDDARGRAPHERDQPPLLHLPRRLGARRGRRPASTRTHGPRRSPMRCAWRSSSPGTARSWTNTIPRRKIGLYVDEWGTWYDAGAGLERRASSTSRTRCATRRSRR